MNFSHAQTIQFPGGSIATTNVVTGGADIDVTDESCPTGATTRIMVGMDVSAIKGVVISSDQAVTLVTNTKHVETATVVGTIDVAGAGNATVIVTAADMVGSPRTVSVAVANNDTAAQVAGKIRTALAADATIIAFWDVGGSSATVALTTREAKATDATQNISVDNGTCTGLTAAPTSAGTLTAGNDTIALLANVPYVWTTNSYATSLLTVDVEAIAITNASGSAALVNIHSVIDATP